MVRRQWRYQDGACYSTCGGCGLGLAFLSMPARSNMALPPPSPPPAAARAAANFWLPMLAVRLKEAMPAFTAPRNGLGGVACDSPPSPPSPPPSPPPPPPSPLLARRRLAKGVSP